jgi:hypothetical protein
VQDGDVVGRKAVTAGEVIDERRVRVADDLLEAVVLHDDDEDVVKRRHR